MVQANVEQAKINVGQADRLFSVGAGALLAIVGVRRGWVSMVMTALGGYLLYRGLTGNCKVYEALDLDSTGRAFEGEIAIDNSVTVNRPSSEVYLFWRNLENLPRFMEHLQSVTVLDGKRSHWVARAPLGGAPLAWDADITEERPDTRIAWASLPGATVRNSGSVDFTSADGGSTRVHVHLRYEPPGGAAGAALGRVFQKLTEQNIADDLRRFKEVMETGQAPASESWPLAGQGTRKAGAAAASQAPAGAGRPARPRSSDVVQEASEDSFPASDPPGYTGGAL